MLRRLGYVAIALTLRAPANRTCRLRNATPARLRELTAMNLDGLRRILDFNAEHDVRLFRITSDLVPFGSHPVNRLAWWDEFAPELSALARLIRRNDLRVSMHPGQFTVLNSPTPAIVEAAVEELVYQARVLDALRTPVSSKIVIHVGGAYGTRDESKARFVSVVRGLPRAIRRRLVVENDCRVFHAGDALDVAEALRIPVVFDWLHHRANPAPGRDAAELIRRCFATWRRADGPPKVHISSQAPGARPGAHADHVALRDFLSFHALAPDVPYDAMLEAKAKELALFRLRAALRRVGVEEHPEASAHALAPRARSALPSPRSVA